MTCAPKSNCLSSPRHAQRRCPLLEIQMTENPASPAEQPAEPTQEAGVRTQIICDGVVYDMILEVDPNDPDHFHMRRVQPETE